MSPLRAFAVALSALAANKLRSVLAVLGIVIGVAAVIMVVAMGKGAQARVEETIRRMGVNLVFVHPGTVSRGSSAARTVSAENLTLEDARAVARLPHVARVAPEVRRTYQVKYLNRNANLQVVGTMPEAVEMRGFRIARGTFFDRTAVALRERVCVMGARAAVELFGDIDPVGRTIQIDRQSFEVLGLLEDKGGDTWARLDESVYVPVTTALYRLFNRRHLSQIMVQIDRPENIDAALQELEREMRRLHGLRAGEENDFRLWSMDEYRRSMEESAGAFTILLSGIALVSLLVGGIGIMNIMLVSVTERTREIGIRKAIGARRRDILVQFLIESMTISLLGGTIGVAAGIAFAQVFPKLPIWDKLSRGGTWESVIAPESIAVAFLFSCGVGIFFGLYPALKASRLNPVDALRYE
jgi:putative ABC transport system permease protein